MPPHMQDPMGGYGGYGRAQMPDSGWGLPGVEHDDFGADEYGIDGMGIPQQQAPEGPCATVPALSLRQPFASLVLHGVKQLEARNRPTLKNVCGELHKSLRLGVVISQGRWPVNLWWP